MYWKGATIKIPQRLGVIITMHDKERKDLEIAFPSLKTE